MTRPGPRFGSLLAGLLLSGCGSAGRYVPVDLPPAPPLLPGRLVGEEVARLLGADPGVSQAAELRLTMLDADARRALLAHAARIPGERDPRWLHVLEENHALPPLGPEEDLDYLVWKAARPEPVYVMRAEGRLADLARREPDRVIARLERGGAGADALAVALGLAGVRRAVPTLVRRYRAAATPEERRGPAEALGLLAGEALRPRLRGTDAEIARDADAIVRWWRGGEEEEHG
jgi:hypothetical protein